MLRRRSHGNDVTWSPLTAPVLLLQLILPARPAAARCGTMRQPCCTGTSGNELVMPRRKPSSGVDEETGSTAARGRRASFDGARPWRRVNNYDEWRRRRRRAALQRGLKMACRPARLRRMSIRAVPVGSAARRPAGHQLKIDPRWPTPGRVPVSL